MEGESFSYMGIGIFACVAFAALVFAVWQYIGKQWVEAKFSEHIAKMGREHSIALETLRRENEALRAAKKLQEMDFAALPATWERLEKAYLAVKALQNFGDYKIDVENLNYFELDEMMNTMEWFQSEINRVKSLDGHVRQDEFDEIRFNYQVRKVKSLCQDLQLCLTANAISYPADMAAELKYMASTLESAIAEKVRLGVRGHAADGTKPLLIDEQFSARVAGLAASIRKKLQSHEAEASA